MIGGSRAWAAEGAAAGATVGTTAHLAVARIYPLEYYEAGAVEAAFVYTFANRHLPTTGDPEHDYDLAARGIVRVLPDGSWTPKAAFYALAEYGRSRTLSRSAS